MISARAGLGDKRSGCETAGLLRQAGQVSYPLGGSRGTFPEAKTASRMGPRVQPLTSHAENGPGVRARRPRADTASAVRQTTESDARGSESADLASVQDSGSARAEPDVERLVIHRQRRPRLSAASGRTTLGILVQHTTKEHRHAHITSGMEPGMNESLDLLEQVAISLR